jgi:replicative DNA helicase
MDITMEKSLPNDLQMERLILGHILMQGSIDMQIEPEIFYLESHRKILACMKLLQDQGKTCDMPTVISSLRDQDELDSSGGLAYLLSLTDGIPMMKALPKQYLNVVTEKWALRKAIQVSNETMVRAYAGGESFAEIASDAIGRMDEASLRTDSDRAAVKMEAAVSEVYKEIEATSNFRVKGIDTGLRTGFTGFDSMIAAGLHESDMMIIAARPGIGKTSLLLGILSNMAKKGKKGIFFSIEMARMQIMKKLICMEAEVPLTRVMTGFLNRDDWGRLGAAAGRIAQWDVWIDDDTNLQVSDIRSRIRRLQISIDFIMVDYLQIMQSPKHLQRATDNEKIGYNSSHLKFLNRDLKIPVIANAQLNRSPDKRRDSTPQLSDLRQSGQIEQDADIVAFIHRTDITGTSEESGMAEIIMAKQRNGPTGSFQVAFMGQFTKFANLYDPGSDTPEMWYNK